MSERFRNAEREIIQTLMGEEEPEEPEQSEERHSSDNELFDPRIKSTLQMNYEQTQLTRPEQELYNDVSKSFASNLMQLHNMKPFDAKAWTTHSFTGRGMLSIPDIILETLKQGRYTLMEKRKKAVNPEKPSVALLMDVSYSMSVNLVNKSAIFLGLSFIEFFGQNFAKDFTLTTIGTSPFTFLNHCDYLDAKKYIVGRDYDDGGTEFIPSFNNLEESGFYEQRNTKYIFIITDGIPENWSVQGIHVSQSGLGTGAYKDLTQTSLNIEKIIYYIENRWIKDDRVEYFWIQLGDQEKFESFIYWLKDTDNGTYIKWCEFLKKQYKIQNIFYTNVKNLVSGQGFHQMVDYFLDKFRRRIKT